MHYELVKKCRALNKHELLAAARLSLSTSSSLLKIPSLTSHCPRISKPGSLPWCRTPGLYLLSPQPPPPIQPQSPCNFPNAPFPLHLSSLHRWLSLSSRTRACAHREARPMPVWTENMPVCGSEVDPPASLSQFMCLLKRALWLLLNIQESFEK